MFLRTCRPLAAATLGAAGINLFHASVLTLVLFRARHDLQASAVATGLVLSVGAVGALVGTFSAARLNRAYGWRVGFLSAYPVLILGAVLIMAATSTTMLAAGYGVDGVGVTLANINYFTARQALTPNELLGRVASITSMIGKIPFPISLIGFGLLADHVSGPTAFGVIALGLAVVAALAIRPVLSATAEGKAQPGSVVLP